MEQKERKARPPVSDETRAKLAAAARARKQTDATKQAISEKAKARNAGANLSESRKKAWTPEARLKREMNTKAATFLTEELYPLLIKLDRAARGNAKMLALLQQDETLNARLNTWDEETKVTFTRSAKDIKLTYGAKSYAIWQKLFVCIQQGGKNRHGDGYPSTWSMNTAAIDDYLAEHEIMKQKNKRPPTISEAVELLMPHDALKRVWADWEIVVADEGFGEFINIVGAGSKIVTTASERAELKVERKKIAEQAVEARALLREVKIAEGK